MDADPQPGAKRTVPSPREQRRARLRLDDGLTSLVSESGEVLFQHNRAASVGSWAKAQGIELIPTHEDPFYQAIDPYTRRSKK